MKYSKLVQTVDIKNIEKVIVVQTTSGFIRENLTASPVCRLPYILFVQYLAICIRKKSYQDCCNDLCLAIHEIWPWGGGNCSVKFEIITQNIPSQAFEKQV